MNEFNDRDYSGTEPSGQPESGKSGSEPPATGSERPQGDESRWPGSQHTGTGGQNGRAGGHRGAPYSPSYPDNTYPPRQGAGGNGPEQNGQGYNPYQYNANSGWQPPQRPQDKYEWKFEDYDRFDNNKKGDKKRANRGLLVFTVVLLCLLSTGLIGLAGYSIYSATLDPVAGDTVESGADVSAPTSAGGELQINSYPEISEQIPVGGKLTIPQVAEVVLPSVVGVIKYDNEQYFEISGYGSGIVMSEDGYIITNAHVVAGGTGFKVQFTDGDAYDAEMVGYDTVTDLAVLKIDAGDLTPAQFGDSDAVKVGESVVAIGNPAGDVLASSVTYGIISAVNREVRAGVSGTVGYTMNYLQTDAAINPGNSGGALANEYGLVIGVNSAKITHPDYEGIGFAIPITEAKPVIDDIISNGRVTGRVMLGISSKYIVDEVDARNYGIQMGVVVESVENPDLIDQGILRGDILTYIDEHRIYDLSDIRAVLDSNYNANDVVELTFYRRIGTREQTFEVEARLMESE